MARQLALKKLRDPANYDRVIVNRMRRRTDDAVTESDVDAEMKMLLKEGRP
jgi:hypothetical protein